MPTAIIAAWMLLPSRAPIATAKVMNGSAMKESKIRSMTQRTGRDENTATSAAPVPSTSAISTASSAASTDSRVPASSRERMSRPR